MSWEVVIGLETHVQLSTHSKIFSGASTAFGAGATEAAIAAATKAIEETKAGTPIFVGPLKDNTGKVVIEGTLGLYDGALWGTDYLLEGIVGSIT